MLLMAAKAEYKLGVAHSLPNIIMVTRTIGLATKPTQIKVATQSLEL